MHPDYLDPWCAALVAVAILVFCYFHKDHRE